MKIGELQTLLSTFPADLEIRVTSASVENVNNFQIDSVAQTTTKTVHDNKLCQITTVEIVVE